MIEESCRPLQCPGPLPQSLPHAAGILRGSNKPWPAQPGEGTVTQHGSQQAHFGAGLLLGWRNLQFSRAPQSLPESPCGLSGLRPLLLSAFTSNLQTSALMLDPVSGGWVPYEESQGQTGRPIDHHTKALPEGVDLLRYSSTKPGPLTK